MTRQIRAIGVLAVTFTIGVACSNLQAAIVTIDFDESVFTVPFPNGCLIDDQIGRAM